MEIHKEDYAIFYVTENNLSKVGGGLMVSALDSRSSDPGLSAGRGTM